MARKDENLSPEEEQLKQLKEDQKSLKINSGSLTSKSTEQMPQSWW